MMMGVITTGQQCNSQANFKVTVVVKSIAVTPKLTFVNTAQKVAMEKHY